MQSLKTKRQVMYNPAVETGQGISDTNETPLTVGLGLEVHKKTRSKGLLQLLSSMNLCISYGNKRRYNQQSEN